MIDVEEVTMCRTYDMTLWCQGWLDRRKFKGHILSRVTSRPYSLDADYDKDDIVRAKVVHGWVLTVAGDTSGCGWDTTSHFFTKEPVIVDGRCMDVEAPSFDEDGYEVMEEPAEVVDGPHKATWLEVKT